MVLPDPKNIYLLRGLMTGPEGTVYDGGLFELKIRIPTDYPFRQPRIVFLTKIYHVNVDHQSGIVKYPRD
jgi:ubiquitin-protein ligase